MDVIVNGRSANEVMEIVQQLRKQGLVQGTDFDFAYHQQKSDYISGHIEVPKHARFTFYDDKWATWFSLRWA